MYLDMYLIGTKYLQSHPNGAAHEPCEDGYRIYSTNLELGIWYNFQPLHQFIIQRFADGIDDGTYIPLAAENMAEVMHAIHTNRLPKTTDLFPQNGSTDMSYTLDVFECAIRWLQTPAAHCTKAVSYIAYWQNN